MNNANSLLNQLRIGNGFDVHPLVKGRPLILGGVKIEHDYGCDGHSDGDVITHSIMDSILGALGQGDLGDHFPSSDNKYKNANSIELLKNIHSKFLNKGWSIINIDSTIILQAPIIKPYIKTMEETIHNICCKLNDANSISIKATTTDHLGFIGNKEGIAAISTCLLIRDDG
tara:strand:- start:420 stop:935 length:516 start_codon:yes stop_codon:yes gene_type:complete